MNSLLYVSFLNEDLRPGYRKKIHSQMESISGFFPKAFLFTVSNEGFVLYTFQNHRVISVARIPFLYNRLKSTRNAFDELFVFSEFCQHVINLCNSKCVSVVYIRRIVPITPKLIKMMKRIKRMGIRLIYEYPTFPWKTEMIKSSTSLTRKVFYLLDSLQYNFLIKIPDLITYLGVYDGNDKRFFLIQNCGDSKMFKCNHAKPKGTTINLIAIAHTSYSHGYDLVIKSLNRYYNENKITKVYFHIIGDISATPELLDLTQKYQLQKYVIFHDFDDGDKLDELCQTADIGVNMIRVENEKLKSVGITTLKTVEYTMRGLPQISGAPFSIDRNKIDIPSFLYVVDESFDMEKVVEFYNGLDYTPSEIRKYGEKHMSWDIVFEGIFGS